MDYTSRFGGKAQQDEPDAPEEPEPDPGPEQNGELEEAARRYGELKRAITDMMFVVDGTGLFLDMNAQFAWRLGYNPPDLLKMHLYEVVSGDAGDPRQKMMPFFARNGGRQALVAKNGRRVPVTVGAVSRYDEAGQFAGALVVCRGLDEGETRAGAIADAAQEMNQPLSGIYGYSELLKGSVAPRDPAYRYAKKIYEQSERLASLVRRIKSEQGLPPSGLAQNERQGNAEEQETDR